MVHDSGEKLKNVHHDGILGVRIGPLEPTGGDGVDDGVNCVLGSGGLLVEDSELENLQYGGERDSGGGGLDVVALNDVEEWGEVDGGVYGPPFLLGVEDQGTQRF